MRKPRLFFKKFYLAIIMLFLYIPIVVMIAQSFNAGKSRAKWEGFSFRWYAELFQDRSIMQALQVTIAVAVIAAIIATIFLLSVPQKHTCGHTGDSNATDPSEAQ